MLLSPYCVWLFPSFMRFSLWGGGVEEGFDVNPWKGEEKEWREKKMDERKETENKRIRK